jgi:hypothetical protein
VQAGILLAQETPRVVAIGDIHGDLPQLETLLRQTGLIDAKRNWAGGKTHLVQIGDVPDRGPDTRAIFELLMKLEKQAKKAGGRVTAIIGNHDAMMVYGDLRYVTPEEFQSFATGKSARVREAQWEHHAEELKAAGKEPDAAYRAKWEAARPLGWFEHRFAFQPGGKLHAWIAAHDAVTKIGDTLFVHAGIAPKYAGRTMEDLNNTVRAELEDLAKVDGGVAADPDGPLWYRGLAAGDEQELAPHVDALLAQFGVKRIVIGHTPTGGAVTPRFGGRVINIDVGLGRAYGSRLACLIIEDGRPWVLHRGKRLELPDSSPGSLERYMDQAMGLEPKAQTRE